MNIHTRDRIIAYITDNRQARAHDLIKQLKKLVSDGLLKKVGQPPLVFYTLVPKLDSLPVQPPLPDDIKESINANFLSITPEGKLLYGMEGFTYWANLYQQNK